jgi:cytochrome c oxidase cbb3-type subunit 2
MKSPQSMYPQSNMPAYAWLADAKLDRTDAEKKMKVLGYPYMADDIRVLEGKTEMDALVAPPTAGQGAEIVMTWKMDSFDYGR